MIKRPGGLPRTLPLSPPKIPSKEAQLVTLDRSFVKVGTDVAYGFMPTAQHRAWQIAGISQHPSNKLKVFQSPQNTHADTLHHGSYLHLNTEAQPALLEGGGKKDIGQDAHIPDGHTH